MNYPDGEKILLGDKVTLDMPDGWREARVVMLGSTREHLDMESDNLEWYLSEGLEDSDIVIEWIEKGEPLPGAYMSTHVNCCIELISRAQK